MRRLLIILIILVVIGGGAAIAMKSASLISRMHAALPTSPSLTVPGGVVRSIVHALVGSLSLNKNLCPLLYRC